MLSIRKIFIAIILISISMVFLAIKPGNKLADFSLPDASGKTHKLSDYKSSKATVLIFVSTNCPVSNAYNGRMEKLYADYSGKNITFLGINSNKNEVAAKIKAHATKNKLNFPILKDNQNVIADQLDATVTPEVFVIGSDLTVLYHGHIDDSQRSAQVRKKTLRSVLDAVIAGKTVTPNITKAFGCSIKRARK